MSFVDKWKNKTGLVPGYASKPTYSPLFSLLSNVASEICLHGNHPSLANNRLNDEDISIIMGCLNSDIVTLSLCYNQVTDEGAKVISDYLKDVNCNLNYLNLAYNDITVVGIHYIAEALQLNTSVQHAIFDGIPLERKGGIEIATMLQVNTTLTHLSLANTHLHTDCIIAMATVLHGNHTIQSLNLSRPILFSCLEESTIHLSKMLKINTTLQELHLSNHGMTDTGVKWICNNLKANTSLLHLNLSCNKLSRDGASHLAAFLMTNPPLKILNINCNRIESEGLISLSTALKSANDQLECLYVCCNSIKDEGLISIAETMAISNNTLQQLYIWGNIWTVSTCNIFRQLLETGRLHVQNTDVQYYEVDGVTYLSRTIQQAL